MSHGTGYLETELLLDWMSNDEEGARDQLDLMMPQEIILLWHTLGDLDSFVGHYLSQKGIPH